MKGQRIGRRRYLFYLLAWLAVLGIGVVVVLLIQRQHQSSLESLLQQNLFAKSVSWQAVQSKQQNNALTYYQQLIEQPEILAQLRAAQRPATRASAREQLLEQLRVPYERLAERGISLLHFVLPDGTSLLRVHAPEHFGDSLGQGRETVRTANEFLVPVHGFEAEPGVSGYRSVFPVVDEDEVHLGSVEFGISVPVLINELTALAPRRAYQVVLDHDPQPMFSNGGLPEGYRSWPASERFSDVIPEAQGAPLSIDDEAVDQIARQIGQDPELRALLEQGDAGARRVMGDGADYIVTQLPIRNVDQEVIGRVLAYVQEPVLGQIDAAFRLNLLMVLTALLLFGLGAHYLIRMTTQKLSEQGRLDLITRSLGQGMYVLDAQGVITEVNPRACKLLGLQREELIGQKAHRLFHVHSGEARNEAHPCPILSATARGERFTGDQFFRRGDGRQLEVSVTSVPLRDQEGSVTLFDDITRQKENERKLHHIAHYDALTGLPNRVLLADRMAQAMARARRTKNPLALAFIDLDGFKQVNDNHGHDAGDQLLVRLAHRMQDCLRETDTVARLGGDEFAVVLTDMADLAGYTSLLDRLLVALSYPEKLDGNELQVSASIGVTMYPQLVDIDADQLLRQADQAMYEAKLAGKNRYRLFDVDRDSDLRGRHEHVERVRQGLELDEMTLYFQPKVNMRTGEVVGSEALIRWQHPERGLLGPAAFLPLISRHTLEIDLGRWVIRRALQHMSYWQKQGLRLPVSVNIAGDHIQHPDFVRDLARQLGRHPQINPADLQLEIVESSALEDVGEVSRVIGECAKRGVDVALDDFGTGYSSLTYLKRLPIRVLKLDQSFVRDMLHDPEDLAILDGVLNLARAFGLETIAEGVSSLEHGRVLLQLGCETAQGYVIARPMPASGVVQWVKDYKLPKAWHQVDRLGLDALELLYVEVECRAWARDLTAYCKGLIEIPPLLDPRQSRLGPRLRANPLIRQRATLFDDIVAIHERMHDHAGLMIRIREEQDVHAALARLPELEAMLEELLSRLRQFLGSERQTA